MRNTVKISTQNTNKSNKAASLLTHGIRDKYTVCELRSDFPDYLRLVKNDECIVVKGSLSNSELMVDTNKKRIKKEKVIVTKNDIDINPDKYYTVSEVAEFLRCKIGTVYTWKWQKKIKAHKCSGKLLFLGKDIKNSIVEQI